MEFSSKNTEVGKPFPSPEDLPHPGIEPESPALQADSLLSEPPGKSITGETYHLLWKDLKPALS